LTSSILLNLGKQKKQLMEKKTYTAIIIIALAAFVLFSAFRKNDSPPKQVWEYKLVDLFRQTGEGKFTDRDDDLKAFTGTLREKFKELGEQGWELVATVPFSSAYHGGYQGNNYEGTLVKTTPSSAGFTNQIQYWFKRLK
jgi:hypothetical protein